MECDTLPGNYYNTIISAPNGTFYGSRVEISCPTGYRLEGPRVITCLASGQWSSVLPRCMKLEVTTLLPALSSLATSAGTTATPKWSTQTTQKPLKTTTTTTTSVSKKNHKTTLATTLLPTTANQQPAEEILIDASKCLIISLMEISNNN